MSTSKRTKLGFLQWLEKIKSVHYANVQSVDVAMDSIDYKIQSNIENKLN